MEENQNPINPGAADNAGGTTGGIPIKFNMPVPGSVPQAMPEQQIPAPLPGPAATPTPAQPIPAQEPPSGQAAATPGPAAQLKKYLIPIIIGSSVLLAIILFIVIGGLMKEEEFAVTEEIYGGVAMQSEQVLTCNENEVMDAKNNCICKTNFIQTMDSDGRCVYDCSTVTQQILDMRADPTVASSTEMAEQLAKLQTEAEANQCKVPEAVKTACDIYMDDSITAMALKDYLGYYENSKKYIEEDCAKKKLGACDIRLGTAELCNRIIALKPPADIRDEMKKELDIQKYAYYNDPQCNDVTARCAKISDKYGIKNGYRPAASPMASVIDPGNVFFDDRDFFLQNCMNEQETQETAASQQTVSTQETQQEVPVKRVPRVRPQ